MKNKNGQDYEPDSLRVMIAAQSIVKDREFHSSKHVLEGKAKLLPQADRGKRSKKSGREDHHDMKVDDSFAKTTMAWSSYSSLKGTPKPDKEACTQHRDFQPRRLAVGGERCPVALFRQFVSRRPQNLKTTGLFHLSIKTNRRPDDNVRFKVQPMGENKINARLLPILLAT